MYTDEFGDEWIKKSDYDSYTKSGAYKLRINRIERINEKRKSREPYKRKFE